MRGSLCLLRVLSVALFVLALAGCVVPVGGPKAAAVRSIGDTNVTNLVTEGDVTVGGDLTVSGECTGCGGSSTHLLYVALLTSDGNNPPMVKVLEKSPGVDVTWTRTTHGLVSGVISPVVNLDQVACFSAGTMDGNDAFTTARIWPAYPGARCDVEIFDWDGGVVTAPAGDFFSNTPVEIRIYP